jgi:predicted ester cyclase
MTTDEMKAVIRRWVEDVWNDGNLGRADELMTPDYVVHVGPQDFHGPAGFKQLCSAYRAAFPDMHIAIDDLIAEGDRVVWRFTARGTQTGQLFDLPPTGKRMEIGGFVISRFAGSRWVEDWANWDVSLMLQQLGAARVPGAPPAPAPATA